MEKKYPIGGYAKELLRDAYELGIMTNAGNTVPTFEQWFDSIDPLAQQAPTGALRETIEDILLKTGKHNQDECSEISDIILKDLPKAPTGGVWVKATSGLPEKHINVIVRNLNTGRVMKASNMGHNTGWDVAMDREFMWDNTEWLDEATEPKDALIPGAPTTTGTYFSVIKDYINDDPQMCVLHYQAHRNIYKAAGHAFNIEVKAEDIVGYVMREFNK